MVTRLMGVFSALVAGLEGVELKPWIHTGAKTLSLFTQYRFG